MQTPPFHTLLEIYPQKDEQLSPQTLKLKDLQRDAISEFICMGLLPENPRGSGLWRGGLPAACSQYFHEAILALSPQLLSLCHGKGMAITDLDRPTFAAEAVRLSSGSDWWATEKPGFETSRAYIAVLLPLFQGDHGIHLMQLGAAALDREQYSANQALVLYDKGYSPTFDGIRVVNGLFLVEELTSAQLRTP